MVIRKFNSLNDIDKENIKKLYLSGYTAIEIGKLYLVSRNPITKILIELNVMRTGGETLKLNGARRKKLGRRKIIDVEKLKKLYLEGWSLKDIGETVGYSRTRICVILKEAGVKIRTQSERTQRTKEKVIKNLTGLDYSEYIEKLPKYIKYKIDVTSVTTKQSIQSLLNHDKRGITGVNGAYQLDHKYSIYYGFKNNVPPEIIGNIVNLEFITWEENRLKHSNCSITLEELYQKYNEYINNKLND